MRRKQHSGTDIALAVRWKTKVLDHLDLKCQHVAQQPDIIGYTGSPLHWRMGYCFRNSSDGMEAVNKYKVWRCMGNHLQLIVPRRSLKGEIMYQMHEALLSSHLGKYKITKHPPILLVWSKAGFGSAGQKV